MKGSSPVPAKSPPVRSPGTRARWGLGFGFLIFVVSIGLALGLATLYRRAVAKQLIARGLGFANIEIGKISVEAFESTHISVRGLTILRPIEVEIGELDAHYSWSSLALEQLESVDARHVLVRAALPGIGKAGETPPRSTGTQQDRAGTPPPPSIAPPSAAASTRPPVRENFADSKGFPRLPARRVDLSGVVIELTGADGIFRLEGEVHATQDESHLDARTRLALQAPIELAAGFRVERPIEFQVELKVEPDEIRASLASAGRIEIQRDDQIIITADPPGIDLRMLAASGEAPPWIEVASAGGRVSAPAYEIAASGFALSAAFAADDLPRRVGLQIADVRDLHHPARIPALALSSILEFGPDLQRFRVTLQDRGDRAELVAHGHHDTGKNRGGAEFHLRPISFAEDGMQPATLFRPLAGLISKVTGSVEALGSATWAAASGSDIPLELRTGVDVALRDVSLTTPLSRLLAINSVIHIDGPWPPSTPPGQRLQIGLIDVGFAVTDTTASFQLNRDLTLNLEEAVLHFAGGTLRTAGLLDLAAPEQALTLLVSGVELESLFALVDLEGLSGNGTLSGAIPVVRTGDAIEIRNGELSNLGDDGSQRIAGWIRYRPGAGVETVAAGQSEFGKALEALKNFHYEELDLRLSGGPSGSVDLLLHLSGSNPDFYAGHPVNFNLDLEVPLATLLEGTTYTQNLVDRIEHDFSAFGSRAANFRKADASTLIEDPLAPPRTGR